MKRLSESFIDDVISRSRTREERTEDDPNLMDLKDFSNYLRTLYEIDKTDDTFTFKDFVHDSGDGLVINLSMGYWLSVEYEEEKIKLSLLGNRLYIDVNAPKLIETLKKEYELGETKLGNSFIIKSEITNNDVIRIIDIMIECAKNNISVHRK